MRTLQASPNVYLNIINSALAQTKASLLPSEQNMAEEIDNFSTLLLESASELLNRLNLLERSNPSSQIEEIKLILVFISIKIKAIRASFTSLLKATPAREGEQFLFLAVAFYAILFDGISSPCEKFLLAKEGRTIGDELELSCYARYTAIQSYIMALEKSGRILLKDNTPTSPLDPVNSQVVLYQPKNK